MSLSPKLSLLVPFTSDESESDSELPKVSEMLGGMVHSGKISSENAADQAVENNVRSIPTDVVDSELEEDEITAQNTLIQEKVLKSGFLWKRAQNRTLGWKKRWFVLRTTKLSYYKDEKEYKLVHMIDMHNVTAIEQIPRKRRQNVFGMVTTERKFYFQAPDTESMNQWIAALKAVHTDLHRLRVNTQDLPSPPIENGKGETSPSSPVLRQLRISRGATTAGTTVMSPRTATAHQISLISTNDQELLMDRNKNGESDGSVSVDEEEDDDEVYVLVESKTRHRRQSQLATNTAGLRSVTTSERMPTVRGYLKKRSIQHKDPIPQRVVPVGAIKSVEMVQSKSGQKKKHQNRFRVVAEDRDFVLSAEKPEERDRWCEGIIEEKKRMEELGVFSRSSTIYFANFLLAFQEALARNLNASINNNNQSQQTPNSEDVPEQNPTSTTAEEEESRNQNATPSPAEPVHPTLLFFQIFSDSVSGERDPEELNQSASPEPPPPPLPQQTRTSIHTRFFPIMHLDDPTEEPNQEAPNVPFTMHFGQFIPITTPRVQEPRMRRFHPYYRVFIPQLQPMGMQGQPAASEDSIVALRKVDHDDPLLVNKEDCTVCQDSLVSEGKDDTESKSYVVTQMPCGHLFHLYPCLIPWLRKSNTCPVCRWELPTENVEYNVGVHRRMLARRVDKCALADIGCDLDGEDPKKGWMIEEKGQLQPGCGCVFHRECLARWMRVSGYVETQEVETGCPRCRKRVTISV